MQQQPAAEFGIAEAKRVLGGAVTAVIYRPENA